MKSISPPPSIQSVISLAFLLRSLTALIQSFTLFPLSLSPSSLYLIQSLLTFSLSDLDLSLIQSLNYISPSVPYISLVLIQSLSPLHLSRSHSVPQSLTPLSLSFSPSVPYTSLALIQPLTFLSLCLSHTHSHCTKSIQIPHVSRKQQSTALLTNYYSVSQSVCQSPQPLAMNHLNALVVQPLGGNEHCILHKACDGDIITVCTLRSLFTSC